MKSPEGYQNCWEYWNCTDEAKEQCPVYKEKDGSHCWLYLDNLDMYDWAKPKVQYKNCLECPWYQKMQSDKGK